MSTGVAVSSKCTEAYEEIKMGRKFRYVLFGITDDNKLIDVTKKAARDATYEKFVEDLQTTSKAGRGLYAVYDYEISEKNTHLIFVTWIPDSISIKAKMLYAGSKDSLKRQFVGIRAAIEANDFDDISRAEIESKLK